MISQVKDVLSRTQDTLVQDAAGVVALMVLLFAALHLPGVI